MGRDESSGGVIYVGHIPHGFYEEELKKYCSQFGIVKTVKVARSKKTGRSRGYAFVQFECAEVAKIVAETMHNYLMFGKLLKCEYVDPSNVHPGMLRRSRKIFTHSHTLSKSRPLPNKGKTALQCSKGIKRLLMKERKKRLKLSKLGVEYDFPGYKSKLQKSCQHVIFE